MGRHHVVLHGSRSNSMTISLRMDTFFWGNVQVFCQKMSFCDLKLLLPESSRSINTHYKSSFLHSREPCVYKKCLGGKTVYTKSKRNTTCKNLVSKCRPWKTQSKCIYSRIWNLIGCVMCGSRSQGEEDCLWHHPLAVVGCSRGIEAPDWSNDRM